MSEGTDTQGSIRKQVEYYFSQQNLLTDHYLVSKMNAQLYVPLEVVAGFKMLRNLTVDLELIKDALKDSTIIHLEDVGGTLMIRPVTTSLNQRTTIILRDIASDVPEEAVRAIFGEQASAIKKIHPDIGSTWFVSFTNESDCKLAFENIQESTFNDEPIKARIKSENLLNSYLPGQTPAMHPPPMPSFPQPTFGYGGGYPSYPYMMSGMNPPGMYGGPPMEQFQGRGKGRGRGGGGGRGGQQQYPQNGGPVGGRGQQGPKPIPSPKLGPQDFPPLPETAGKLVGGYPLDDPPTQYTKEDIISVLMGLQGKISQQPAGIPAGCLAAERNSTIELTRDAMPEEPTGKTFAEAAITAKDIKGRRNSGRGEGPNRNSWKGRGSGGRGRGSRNSRPDGDAPAKKYVPVEEKKAEAF